MAIPNSSTLALTLNRSRHPQNLLNGMRQRLTLILRPSADGLEDLHRRATEVRESMTPEEFRRWFRGQSEATKQEMDATLEELNKEVERSQPKREHYDTQEEYDEAVGVWMLGGQEAMKGVRSFSQFFMDLLNQIKAWLQSIMEAIKTAIKKGYEKIQEFIRWFSQEVVEACKSKMSDFFASL
ncbi:hypothetical protein L7F22_005492 [Adiantum nelumboides]|nr:hypothetical protein [Adiantum nelumboides]